MCASDYRLIQQSSEISEQLVYSEINYADVNCILNKKREDSKNWLYNSLKMPVSEKSFSRTVAPDFERCRMVVSMLRQYGIKHVVLSSGTRNLTLCRFFEANECFKTHMVIDERRALMDEMYDILKEKFDGCHIIEFPHYVIGDSNHKFGTFGLYYHSLYDEYGKNAIDIICQRHSSKEEKILLDELMERYSYKFLELRHEIEKKHRAIEKKGKSIISTLADIQYR